MNVTLRMKSRQQIRLRYQPGLRGPTGLTGSTGPTGPANTLTIGTVTALDYGDPAEATITGTAPNQVLNLGLPAGEQGPSGSVTDGDKGDITVSGAGTVWNLSIGSDISWGSNKITGLGDATAATHAMNRQTSDARYLALAGVADGSNAAPSITFASDPDTGFYRAGSNNLGIATSGLTRLEVTEGSGEPLVQVSGSLSVDVGSASNPSLTFFASQNMGFYRISSTALGVSVAGNERMRFTDGAAQSSVQVLGQIGVPDGTTSYPGYGFASDITTGIWRPAGTQMAFSVSASEKMRILTNSVNVGISSALNVSTGSDDGLTFYTSGTIAASANGAGAAALRRRGSDGAIVTSSATPRRSAASA